MHRIFNTITQLYNGSNINMMSANAADSHTPFQTLQVASGISGFFGAIGVASFSGAKWAFSDEPIKALYVLYAVSYLAYVMPNIPAGMDPSAKNNWDTITNDVITGISVLKTFVDISLCNFTKGSSGVLLTVWNTISPSLEAFINIAWEVPVIAGIVRDHQSATSIVGFIGNTIFNAGGWITPGTFYPEDVDTPPVEAVKSAFFAATIVCTGLYGMLAGMQGMLYYTPPTEGYA